MLPKPLNRITVTGGWQGYAYEFIQGMILREGARGYRPQMNCPQKLVQVIC